MQSQLILGPIFGRACESLNRSGGILTAMTKKTTSIWVVHDKKRFQTLIAEIKKFNNSLNVLFPDLSSDSTRNTYRH